MTLLFRTGGDVFSQDEAIKLGSHEQSVFVEAFMGHCKGKDNVKKRAVRRKKTERLKLAKSKATEAAK